MNSKRRAELQRKLSMGAVPRPPAGLAERIKADIPNYLDAETARRGFSWSFTMRVAASIILLITTALVTLRIIEPEQHESKGIAAVREPIIHPVMPLPQQREADAASAPRAETEVSLQMSEALPKAPPAAKVAPTRQALPVQLAEAGRLERTRADEGVVGGTANGVAAAEPRDIAYDSVTEVTAMAPPPPPAAAPAPVAPPQPVNVAREEARRTDAESITVTGSAPSLVPEARAATLSLQKSSVFGISVDPDVFHDIKTTIEHGERPQARNINVEALVNYFAGTPAKPPRRDVTLEVEASPSPVPARGERAILRFTVDTAQIDVERNASVPPVATDARIDIRFNPSAVESFRRIGDTEPVTPESALLYNTSVTGLYDVQLKSRLRATERVATIRLTYKSVTDGRERTVQREVRGSDLAKTWARASRRHRLATLGAVWSESLKGTNGGSEVARRAAELASQNPKDERARELADAASATTGGER